MTNDTGNRTPDLFTRWRTGELDQAIAGCNIHKLAAALEWPANNPCFLSQSDVHRLAVLAAYEAGKREALAQFAGSCKGAPAWAADALEASRAEAWELALLAAEAMDTRPLEVA
jgi:hypothetical protein